SSPSAHPPGCPCLHITVKVCRVSHGHLHHPPADHGAACTTPLCRGLRGPCMCSTPLSTDPLLTRQAARMTTPASRTTTTFVRRPGVLAVLSAAQFLIALDYSIVYIALPSVARDLRLGPTTAQWVISAYALLFAGFLLVGGRLADRIGAGQLFVLAIVLFGAASGAGGAARAAAVLLAARATQGFGAALLQPAILGVIGTTFPAGASRSRALAVWGSVGAAGLAAGAILGGLLTTASWRLTFYVNVPL